MAVRFMLVFNGVSVLETVSIGRYFGEESLNVECQFATVGDLLGSDENIGSWGTSRARRSSEREFRW